MRIKRNDSGLTRRSLPTQNLTNLERRHPTKLVITMTLAFAIILFLTATHCSLSVLAQMEGLAFGLIELQMRSRSSTDRNNLLFSVLTETGEFLDQVLKVKFQKTDNKFSHVTLAVDDFNLEDSGDEDVYYSFVNLQGVALFQVGTAPSDRALVQGSISVALDEKSDLFVEGLRSSSNPFLKNITFAIVNVDESKLKEALPPAANTAPVENSSVTLQPWAIALIALVGGTLLVMALLIFRCYCRKAYDNGQIPVTKKPSVQTASSASSEDEDARKYKKRSPSVPSPLHSITSQDSSHFTYNPTSRGSNNRAGTTDRTEENDDGACNSTSNSKHSISFFGVSFYTQSSNVDVDVDAWQKGSTVGNSTLPPFGHDISSIEVSKRDLSLIEEGENEEMTPHSSVSGSTSGRGRLLKKSCLPHPVRLSHQALVEMERNDRRISGSRLNLNGSAARVIDDLNDLSAQIDDYRRR